MFPHDCLAQCTLRRTACGKHPVDRGEIEGVAVHPPQVPPILSSTSTGTGPMSGAKPLSMARRNQAAALPEPKTK